MAIQQKLGETEFGIGDVVRVHQKIIEGVDKKTRTQVFEGTVIAFKNRDAGKTFTVRRIGAQKIGIEQIFPLNSPLIEKIEVSREGKKGSRRAKLYYIRDKSKKEIESIYTRATRRDKVVEKANKKAAPIKKVASKKSPTKKASKK